MANDDRHDLDSPPQRRAVERVLRPLRDFLDTESSGAIVLVAATIAALVWANSPLADAYADFWTTEVSLEVGDWQMRHDLRYWINDGLMTVFFLVVALEIKRELVEGELRGIRRAALPVVAALGGMIVPALVYLALNPSGAEARGWGVPMATDIAFALGVIALAAPRLPQSAKVLLLSLAIVDDIGAIVVIAVFYSSGLDLAFLCAAGIATALMWALRAAGVSWPPLFVLLGLVVWLTTLESGVHATIAGVAIGLVTPVGPAQASSVGHLRAGLHRLLLRPSPREARAARTRARLVVGPAEWVGHLLHPWTSFVIIPLFALANAGIEVDVTALRQAISSPVSLGVFFGLVVGKPLGVSLAIAAASRMGVGMLPEGTAWRQVIGLGALAGIGFTVSLFITDLAFADGSLIADSKMAILAASVCAAATGAALLRGHGARREKIEA